MTILELTIFPLDKGQSLSQYVARCVEIIHASGLAYQCHAMGTLIEGQYDQVMQVARQCFKALEPDCDRIECTMRIDYRKSRQGRLQAKVDSIEARLGHPVTR